MALVLRQRLLGRLRICCKLMDGQFKNKSLHAWEGVLIEIFTCLRLFLYLSALELFTLIFRNICEPIIVGFDYYLYNLVNAVFNSKHVCFSLCYE